MGLSAAPGMHVEWVDNEAVVLQAETKQVHYLNPPAALAYALILEHGFETAMEELHARYIESPEAHQELSELIERFRDAGLLIDE